MQNSYKSSILPKFFQLNPSRTSPLEPPLQVSSNIKFYVKYSYVNLPGRDSIVATIRPVSDLQRKVGEFTRIAKETVQKNLEAIGYGL
jgi:hypothetical protein